MNFLVIETSSEKSFALLSAGGTISHVDLPSRQQRDHLLPAIDHLLNGNDLALKDLDFIAVGNGPGSFTGTRIGALTAKTLCFANELPLISFCSLIAFTPSTSEPFLLLLDARSHGFYAYDGTDATLLETIPAGNLYSPHPSRIPASANEAPVNFPFLLRHLEQSFVNGEITHPSSLRVTYLHSP